MRLRTIGTNHSVLEFESGVRVLFSYESPVAVFIPNEGYEQTDRFISRTTLRHIHTWIGREPCKLVSQDQIARRIGDQPETRTVKEDNSASGN